MDRLIKTVVIILSIPLILYLAGSIYLRYQTKKELRALVSVTGDISGMIYREKQLEDLPEPVQRYFKFALRDGQAYVSTVYLKHGGQFRTDLDKAWIDIRGKQYFTAEEPGFLWQGRTSLFSVRDMYISGKGRIKVVLLNLIRIVNGRGVKIDQGELLRWLGESVWFPTNLLPGPRLSWEAIDKDRARLIYHYRNHELAYLVSFDTTGAITQLETERYMGEGELETWVGRVGAYREINGMRIPMRIEAYWVLSGKEHCYARFHIEEIHHNVDLLGGVE